MNCQRVATCGAMRIASTLSRSPLRCSVARTTLRRCSSAATSTHSRWGTLGMQGDQLEALAERVRDDGDKQRQVASHLMRLGGTFKQPQAWFDSSFRQQLSDALQNHTDRMARNLDRSLIDGCEAAYSTVAAEWCSERPDFGALASSGALTVELARELQQAVDRVHACGKRPVLHTERLSAEPLMIHWLGDGFLAVVAFRARDVQELVPLAADQGETIADEATGVNDAYEDVVQLWTFEGDDGSVSVADSFELGKSVGAAVSGGDGPSASQLTTWRLRDINFVVSPYRSPEFSTLDGYLLQYVIAPMGMWVSVLGLVVGCCVGAW
eukprot:1826070-Prymnesium_polylepis.1